MLNNKSNFRSEDICLVGLKVTEMCRQFFFISVPTNNVGENPESARILIKSVPFCVSKIFLFIYGTVAKGLNGILVSRQ